VSETKSEIATAEAAPAVAEAVAAAPVAKAEPAPVTQDAPEDDVKMTIWEHLTEFRNRVVRAAAALFIGTCVAWAFRVQILGFLILPYERAWRERGMPGAPELQTL
jgi:Sec-independent protein secretion pathway component TatC